MSKKSELYNALPMHIRNITQQIIIEYHLRDLFNEKDRAIKYHKALMREINYSIRICKKDLLEGDK